MPLGAGAKLGPYEIIELLGTGGMGEVYRARDPRLARDVAIKVVRGEIATDRARVRRLEQEAKATGALNHPNILAVYDVGTHDGTPYVVSELLEGHTLRTRLEDGRTRRSATPCSSTIGTGPQRSGRSTGRPHSIPTTRRPITGSRTIGPWSRPNDRVGNR